jgi:hypothetical protein
MVRKHHFFREDQLAFIAKLPGNDSEHVRQALDDYILKKKFERIDSAKSPSISKGISINGESI